MLPRILTNFRATIAVFAVGVIWLSYSYEQELAASERACQALLHAVISDAQHELDPAKVARLAERAREREIIDNARQDAEYAPVANALAAVQERHELATPVYVLARRTELDAPPRYFVACSAAASGRPTELSPPAGIRESWNRGGFLPRYRDEFGTWLSIFAPIEQNGEVVGVIVADLPFDAYVRAANLHFQTGIGIVVLLLLVVVCIERRTSRSARVRRKQDRLRRRWLETDAANARSESTAKSRFLASLSSELRLSLETILDNSRRLLESRLSPDQYSHVRDLDRTLERTISTIKDLSTIVDLEEGRFRATSSSFGITELFASIESQLSSDLERCELAISFEAAGSIPERLVGDGPKLRRALQKLLENSLRFTEVGRIRMTASVVATDHGSCRLRFEITDSGRPLSDAELETSGGLSLYTSTTGAAAERTGVDVAIAQFFVRCLGSELEVSQSESGGARFAFEPIFETTEASFESLIAPLAPTTSGSLPTGLRILVAEDDAASRRLATVFLQKHRVDVVAVEDGLQAVEAYEREPFDVVLMDCLMPELDGLEAARRIRDRESTLGLDPALIIAVTAHSLDEDRESCRIAGMDSFLKKPYRPEALEKLIRRELFAHRGPTVDLELESTTTV